MGKLSRNNSGKMITIILAGLLLCGCGVNGNNPIELILSETEEKRVEEQSNEKEPAVDGIEAYNYPAEFEVDDNLESLLNNMAIYYKNYDSKQEFDENEKTRFISNFCQNSWFCFDYIYDSLEKSGGLINKKDVEYIYYSFSGNHQDFSMLDDDDEIDINNCSSGFLYAELKSYKVIASGEKIMLQADFDISNNSTERADITLIKNEYSCFDGYSVETFNVI